MKGIIFTKFLEMLERDYSLYIAKLLILESELASKGVYTWVGFYDFMELLKAGGNLVQFKTHQKIYAK